MRVHDVTLTLRADMPMWPDEPGPRLDPLKRIARGESSNVSLLTLADHTGTHVDPPAHFLDGGATVDRIPLESLVGECQVVAYDEDEHISGGWLDSAAIHSSRVLFRTRNSERWRERVTAFDEDFIALDETAAHWLVRRKVLLAGVDGLSVEPFGSGRIGHPVHLALLRAAVVIVEGVDLHDVAPGTYQIVCAPLKIEGGTGSPARVLLIET